MMAPVTRADERQPYSPEIDGLRAIAVLGVVLFHVGLPGVGGGYTGVDVFFVISGFLISRLLVAEHARAGRIAFAAFFARRMRRLLPALLVLVVVTVAAAWWLLSPALGEVQATARAGVASLGLVSNVFFLGETGNYFDRPAGQVPLLHIWSLSVEEQFYLVWPLLVALTLKAGVRGMRWGVAVFALASWALAFELARTYPQAAFYLTPARGWEFALGGLVALWRPQLASARARSALVNAGLVATIAGFILTPDTVWFPALGALLPVGGTALMLAGLGAGEPTGLGARLLGGAPTVYVGRLSYSWYLWHWPPLAIYAAATLEGGTLAGRLAIGVATLGMADLSTRFVEAPFRRRVIGGAWSDARTLLTGGAASAIAIAGMLGVGYVAREEMPRLLAAMHAEPAPAEDPCSVHPGATTLADIAPPCLGGPADSAVVVLWGDSHAVAWKPFAEALARDRGLGFVMMTYTGCPPLAVRYSDPDGRRGLHERMCNMSNVRAARALHAGTIAGRRIATVVMAQRWFANVRRGWSVVDLPRYDARTAQVRAAEHDALLAALAPTLSHVNPAVELLYMGPLPELRNTARFCLARHVEDACAMPRALYDSLRADVLPAIERAIAPHAGRLIDAGEYFCEAARCPLVRNGVVLFGDDDHIGPSAARAVAAQVIPILRATPSAPGAPPVRVHP
ncbi:MAG: acyltransferase [Gemmatimonadetes bacterium]|nr:acyltransferase [Gemmatimonadota bacterium]